MCEVLATDVKENVETIATISGDEARRQVLGLEESLEAAGVAFPVLEPQLVQLDDKVARHTVGAK